MVNKVHSKNVLSDDFFTELQLAVRGTSYWSDYLEKVRSQNHKSVGVHLAIFVAPYLRFIIEGKKTVESRFSINRIAPYHAVHKGDIILLKKSGGSIEGICEVDDVWFYRLDPQSWIEIKKNYTKALCAQDPLFWSQRQNAEFATLIRIRHPQALYPIAWTKHDRRGWVVLQHSQLKLARDDPYM